MKFNILSEKRLERILQKVYYSKEDSKFSTVMSIMRWVDSKEIASLDNNNNASSVNNNNMGQ